MTLTLAALVLVATGRGVAQRKANYYAVGDDVIDVKPSNYRANSRPSYRTKRKVYEAKNGDIS